MKKEKRDQILEAALELLAAQGFRGTSTAEIARHAGVATGTLFHHFKTKEELINTLYLKIKTNMAESLLLPSPGVSGMRDELHNIWHNYVSWALERRQEYRFMKHCEASPYISGVLRKECEVKFLPLWELFEQAIADGVIKELPLELLMNMLAGTMDGFLRYLIAYPEAVNDKELWEKAYLAAWDTIR